MRVSLPIFRRLGCIQGVMAAAIMAGGGVVELDLFLESGDRYATGSGFWIGLFGRPQEGEVSSLTLT